MECPDCKSDMSSMGRPHYAVNGDSYTYYWCDRCRCEYEVIEDHLFGGEPTINKI